VLFVFYFIYIVSGLWIKHYCDWLWGVVEQENGVIHRVKPRANVSMEGHATR